MSSTDLGILAIALESTTNQGRQLLLAETTVSATMSATTQPIAVSSASSHMHLHIIIKGATASGTVTIAGKKSDGTTAVTETTPTIAVATSTQPSTHYCTQATYNSINSSGITTTGLTGATITVYGILQATKLVPVTYDPKQAFDPFNPNDHRGINYHAIRWTQLNKKVTFDKFESAMYPETDTFLGFTLFNSSPTTATVPGTPDALKTTTAVSGTPLSLTTQPTAPGELLQLVVTGTAVYGTITITGTNQYGQAITEVVTCVGGAGTFYTQNVFASVGSGGIAITGLTSGSLAVNGFFGTKWTYLLSGTQTLQTLCIGAFSGTETALYPFSFFESAELDMDVMKEIKVSAKIAAQDAVIVGNRSTSPMNTSRLPSLGQPFDGPVVGWNTLIYIDSLSGTAFTTAYNDLLTCKIKVATGQKPVYTATNSQLFNRVYVEGKSTDLTIDATVDFTDSVQYELFRQNVKQLVGIKFQSPYYIGNSSGPLFKYWQFTLPLKYEMFDLDRSKEKVEAKIAGIAEYEPSLGYAAKLEILNQIPPNYATT